MKQSRIEIFCGTGGVGKTTLATSRAVHHAHHGKKVLLITIDPSLRLKQVLGLDQAMPGQVHEVNADRFKTPANQLWALLMSPGEVMKRLGPKHQLEEAFKNPLFTIFTRPYGGMNEILAILEVFHYLQTNDYDIIVLDTPPGKHFVDFLQSARKINQFFDQTFVDIFLTLGKKVLPDKQSGIGRRIWNSVIAPTVKKLLGLLNRVTGEAFVDQFIDAVSTIYLAQESFSEALALESKLADPTICNWYLVTASDHSKLDEALDLHFDSKKFYRGELKLFINRCLHPDVYHWNPSDNSGNKLKVALVSREERIISRAKECFQEVYLFPEALSSSPREQVMALASAQV